MSETQAEPTNEKCDVTLNDFYLQLRERVSIYNAKLLLQTAAVRTGVNSTDSEALTKETARAMCLELIKSGGPSFQVGKSIYTRLQ